VSQAFSGEKKFLRRNSEGEKSGEKIERREKLEGGRRPF
jgi:hypothetical protein